MDLPDLTLVPGLMDMEVDLVLGGPGAGLHDPVRMDPVQMGLRAVANGQRTLRAGFTTVRNLGLFIKTGGYMVDVALADAIDRGWVEGPRVIPAGHAICPTGGHLDPSAQSGLAPGIMPMTVEEGIADGIDEIRVPSERSFRSREEQKRTGLVIDRVVYDALRSLHRPA